MATRTNQPATMRAEETLKVGVLFKKELWADEISIGSLVLSNVPVRELDLKEESDFPDHAATLGLYALRRLDFVLDGKNGMVYARPRGDVPPAYVHNHVGAAFGPEDHTQDTLLAHVVSGSPAYLAGNRDGDVLLKVDDLEVTKWRTDPRIRDRHFWEQPAGTTYKLTLKRGDREYQATVTLESILGPSGPSAVPMSLAELRSKAEKGDAQAQNELGKVYFLGKYGVAKDGVEAVRWYRKAAEQNDGFAQYKIGLAYANGIVVAKDEVEAVKWFRKAAEQNNVAAQANLGLVYAKGIGVKKDEVEGVMWLLKAAQQNDAGA